MVGDKIFGRDDKLEPYYAASYGLYRLDWLFRNDARFEAKYKTARFYILLALRLLVNGAAVPFINSREMEKRANEIINKIWGEDSDKLFLEAVKAVDDVAGSDMERDHIRRKEITDSLLEKFGLNPEKE